jgi:hypothetical protein
MDYATIMPSFENLLCTEYILCSKDSSLAPPTWESYAGLDGYQKIITRYRVPVTNMPRSRQSRKGDELPRQPGRHRGIAHSEPFSAAFCEASGTWSFAYSAVPVIPGGVVWARYQAKPKRLEEGTGSNLVAWWPRKAEGILPCY